MFIKFLFFNIILVIFLNFKPAIASNQIDFEELPKDPFILICNFLDIYSFKNLDLTSKKIHSKILKSIQISEEKNENEVKALIEKFSTFLKNKEVGISVEEYFGLFSFNEMKKNNITPNDILAYRKIQQSQSIAEIYHLKFGRVATYGKFNSDLYACFHEDFQNRAPKFNGGRIDQRKIVLLQWGEIDFLSPCIREFKNMTDLHLYNNKLSFIPKEIGLCADLKYIDLGHNKLTSLPWEIAKCTSLNKLILRGNPDIKAKEIENIFSKKSKVNIYFDEEIRL